MSSSAESRIAAAAAGKAVTSYCLRWNTFTTHLTKGMAKLLEEDEFTDVTLACDGEFLKAHRVLLSLCSPFFKRLFRANEANKSGSTIVILNNVRFKDLECIIQFIYHGQVNVQQADLSTFLKTAELLQIEGLAQPDGEEDDKSDSKEEQVEEESQVTSPTLPCLQPAPASVVTRSHSNKLSSTMADSTQVVNSIPPRNQVNTSTSSRLSFQGQGQPPKKIKLGTNTSSGAPTSGSRLQSILTGQKMYTTNQSSPPLVQNSILERSCSSSMSIPSDPLGDNVKDEMEGRDSESEEHMFLNSDVYNQEDSVEIMEQQRYSDNEEQERFDDPGHDEMSSEEFLVDLAGDIVLQGSSSTSHTQKVIENSVKSEVQIEMILPDDAKIGENVQMRLPSSQSMIYYTTPPSSSLTIPRVHQELERLLFSETRGQPELTSDRSQQPRSQDILGDLVRQSLNFRNEQTTNTGMMMTSSHDEEAKAQCPYCLKFYKNRSSLKVHKSVYHRNGSMGSSTVS